MSVQTKPHAKNTSDDVAPVLIAGLLLAVLNVVFMISFAAFLLPGELSSFLPIMIGSLIIGSAVVGLVVGLTSSIEGMVATVQDVPIAVMSLAVGNIAASLFARGVSAQLTFMSVLAFLIITSVVTGVIFLILGRFRLGGFVRYLPYPVIGGFLAGSGWLLFKGGLEYVAGISLSLNGLAALLAQGQATNLILALMFAVLVLAGSRKIKHQLFLPAVLLAGFLLFYAILPVTGTTLQGALDRGDLLGPFPGSASYEFLTLDALSGADWSLIFREGVSLITIFGISTIALLLNTSGIELELEKEVDLNKELQSAGWGSLAAGIFGSPIAFHTLVHTALGNRLGAKSRWLGPSIALFTVPLLLLGADLIQFLPKVIVGGVLLFIGISFLVDWLYETWFRLPKDEYIVIALIVIVIASIGFLEGVALGILAAVAIFAVNYANIHPVENALSGKDFRSSVQHHQEEIKILDEYGESIYILRLQGYVFFGTANHILEKVRKRLKHKDLMPLKFLVFDFNDVVKLDSTAAVSFNKIENLAKEFGFQVVLTDLKKDMLKQLKNGGYGETFGSLSHQYVSIDFGLEHCEQELINDKHIHRDGKAIAWFPKELSDQLPARTSAEQLLSKLEKVEFSEGEELIAAGTDEDVAFLIAKGRVDFLIEAPDGAFHRLESVSEGMLVGEEQLYEDMLTPYSIVARSETEAYKLTDEILTRLGKENPDIRVALDLYIIGVLANKLNRSRRLVESFLYKS